MKNRIILTLLLSAGAWLSTLPSRGAEVLVEAEVPTVAHARNRKFVFKIKTKTGGIVGNVAIEASDMEAAKHKLRQRYPDCEILEAKEK